MLSNTTHKLKENSARGRIFQNTLMLYFRQILIMLVSLYTVRVVLETLGAEDYGIYNVVAGVVVLFSFLNGAMSSATQRFLNYALGQNNTEQARDVYSISFVIYFVISLLVIILAETAGLWFFNTHLNIPSERRAAALAVYQFSVAVTVINILRVPYNAVIIAYEKMSFFALISVIEGFLKFSVVFLLALSPVDTLIFYAFLVCLVELIILLVYKIYCNKAFEIAHFRYCKDRELFNKLVGFSGWSIFGGVANLSSSQGTNILINIFFGVTVNAAMGIASQVNSAVYQFVSNFQTAFKPQIVKSYAAKDYDYFMRLIFLTSKASFYLLFFFVLPLYINAGFVLQIWLKNVPEYTATFTRLILLSSLIDAISGPLWMAVQATGNIKKYQIIVSCLIFANLPLSFLFLWLGFSPVWVLITRIGICVLTLSCRIFFSMKLFNLSILSFLREVIIPALFITSISSLITRSFYTQFNNWTNLVLSCIVSTLCITCLVYFIGLNAEEKSLFKGLIRRSLCLRS